MFCDVPIMSNKFTGTVIHVEKENMIYIQKSNIEMIVNQLLDDMYDFYETQGSI